MSYSPAILNTRITAHCSGLRAIFESLLRPAFECMSSGVIKVIIYLMNDEGTRKYIRSESGLQVTPSFIRCNKRQLILWPLLVSNNLSPVNQEIASTHPALVMCCMSKCLFYSFEINERVRVELFYLMKTNAYASIR